MFGVSEMRARVRRLEALARGRGRGGQAGGEEQETPLTRSEVRRYLAALQDAIAGADVAHQRDGPARRGKELGREPRAGGGKGTTTDRGRPPGATAPAEVSARGR